MFTYKVADTKDLEEIWDYNIRANAGDDRWVKWKTQLLADNAIGVCKTFVVLKDKQPIGEITLLLKGDRPDNIIAARIMKEYEGQGHISKLLKLTEDHARAAGIKHLTIGCEAKETRSLAMYLHWGFTEFISSAIEDKELVLYYRKAICL